MAQWMLWDLVRAVREERTRCNQALAAGGPGVGRTSQTLQGRVEWRAQLQMGLAEGWARTEENALVADAEETVAEGKRWGSVELTVAEGSTGGVGLRACEGWWQAGRKEHAKTAIERHLTQVVCNQKV